VVLALVGLLASSCTWIRRASVDTTGGDLDNHSLNRRSAPTADLWRSPPLRVIWSPATATASRTCSCAQLTSTRVSVDTTGGDPDGDSFEPDRFFDVFVRAVVTPTVDSVTPNSLARGTTATLAVTGSGFLLRAQATAESFTQNGSVTVNSVAVVSETELQLSVSIAANAPTGTRHLAVLNPGTGPGALATGFGGCENCLTIT
jgi:hypothetical protein